MFALMTASGETREEVLVTLQMAVRDLQKSWSGGVPPPNCLADDFEYDVFDGGMVSMAKLLRADFEQRISGGRPPARLPSRAPHRLPMLESDVPIQVQRRAEVAFTDVQFIEDNGWKEECPTLFGWLFSHPAHGVHLFEHAVQLARSTESQVSVDTTHA